MMVKSVLEKIVLKFLHAGDTFPYFMKVPKITVINYLLTWRDFKMNFSRPLFTIIFRPIMIFLDTNSILRVKSMYESIQ